MVIFLIKIVIELLNYDFPVQKRFRIARINQSFYTNVMEKSERQELLQRLLDELASGKEEEEVKKEFYTLFPDENPWKQSEKASIPLKKVIENYDALYEDENPLVIFAQENGAIRALMKNLLLDLEHCDEDLGKRMVVLYIDRLRNIQIHYRKKKEIFLPFLKERNLAIDGILFKDEEVLNSLKNLWTNLKEENVLPYKKDIQEVCIQIEAQIKEENQVILPYIEENASYADYLSFVEESDKIGYCLIQYHKKNPAE